MIDEDWCVVSDWDKMSDRENYLQAQADLSSHENLQDWVFVTNCQNESVDHKNKIRM